MSNSAEESKKFDEALELDVPGLETLPPIEGGGSE